MGLLRRLVRGKRGQSLVELAMLLPVLMLLALGSIDFGRVFFTYVSVTNAARNGAQYASASPGAAADLDGIRDAALDDTGELPNASPGNPSVSSATGTDSQGRLYADVTVSFNFNTLFPWPGIPDSLAVGRTVRARVAE